MPDIDIDFCMNRRGEVIEYVTEKYGREQVAQIITFNTMAAKAAIKDVGRVMEMPYGEVDRIAKLVPPTIEITLEQALKDSPPTLAGVQHGRQDQGVDRHGAAAGGLVRGAGVHAAGVVISPRAADGAGAADAHEGRGNRDQLRHEGRREDGPAQDGLPRPDDADGDRRCLKLIKANRGEDVDMATIPLDDQARPTSRCFTRR